MGPKPRRSRQVRVREGMLWVRMMLGSAISEFGVWGKGAVLDGPRKRL